MPAPIKDIKKAMRLQAETANMSHQMRQRILSVPNLSGTAPRVRTSQVRTPRVRTPRVPPYIFKRVIFRQVSLLAASLVIGIFVVSFFLTNSSDPATRQANVPANVPEISAEEWVFSPSAFDENSLDPSGIFTTNFMIE